jgi:hypothetical protein
VVIFAREVTDGLTSLVKKVDETTVKNSGVRMGSFVVFCNDDESLEKKLKGLAKKEGIKKCILSIVDRKAGPSGYKLSPDADVTVLLYRNKTVMANHAFKKGDLTEKDVEKILADVSKIVPSRK